MKKTTIFTVIVSLLLGMMFGVVLGNQNKYHEYPKSTVVSELDYETDTVVCVDSNGFEWCFIGIEDWSVGDVAAMIMYDNYTETIFDDKIISVRYN